MTFIKVEPKYTPDVYYDTESGKYFCNAEIQIYDKEYKHFTNKLIIMTQVESE